MVTGREGPRAQGQDLVSLLFLPIPGVHIWPCPSCVQRGAVIAAAQQPLDAKGSGTHPM